MLILERRTGRPEVPESQTGTVSFILSAALRSGSGAKGALSASEISMYSRQARREAMPR
jgi:hypothetical protein